MPVPELTRKNRVKQRSRLGIDRQLEKNLLDYEMGARATRAKRFVMASAPVVAVGLGAFTLPQMMLGEVVCTPTHESVHGFKGQPGHLLFDLNHDGINDASVGAFSTYGGGSGYVFRTAKLGAYGLATGDDIAAKKGNALAGRSGQKLGPSVPVSNAAIMASSASSRGPNTNRHSSRGYWLNVKNPRFLGVKFLISGETHFGWIRISSVTLDRVPVQATVTGYAYETVPNKPIIAGACKDEMTAPDAMMELAPGSLGQLATGAAGR